MRQRSEQLTAAFDPGGVLPEQLDRRPLRALGQCRNALMLMGDAVAMGCGIGAQAGRQPHRRGSEPFSPRCARNLLRAAGSLRQSDHALLTGLEARAQDLRAEPSGNA